MRSPVVATISPLLKAGVIPGPEAEILADQLASIGKGVYRAHDVSRPIGFGQIT